MYVLTALDVNDEPLYFTTILIRITKILSYQS